MCHYKLALTVLTGTFQSFMLLYTLYYFQLTIRVTDVNDNAPKFELPDYQAHNVDEDIPLGTSILKVKAMDSDSGKNAEIEYMVSGMQILI